MDSETPTPNTSPSNPIRLDAIDRVILRELTRDARVPNNVLAATAGIAPSTCINRVRALQESGVITGFHAHINLESVGISLFALISVRIHSHARHRMREIARALGRLGNVQSVFFLGGERDFLLHVACETPSQLRDFITEHLGADPAVSNTQTNIVFEHLTNNVAQQAWETEGTGKR
ncbi:Lrp/AsnC family transcriptional regulator [Klugiella xanthotipulae]|uniref:DNA-binding Lrp family transcriptional regulator n=1 Tax=Klugiella xanthotipulae TaxID=244735 RepID=A0A543I6S8_9MICO|nr:Lrp/AsnC family transcriptional regulator [Klugiella xanthotipulae]TQM66200.1 DNA-binding Lrp family transcriptional regulator [Klugiella xanthotipulae]